MQQHSRVGQQLARAGRGAGVVRGLAASALALGLALTVVPPALAQDFRFTQVRVEGNERVDAATVQSYAGIGPGQALTAGELNDAYQRIVNSGLFETVEIVPQGGVLVIRVQEYPTVNVINFEGNARLSDEVLSGLIQSQSRRVYSPSLAEADALTIIEAYRQQGRLAAAVEPRIIRRDGNRVDLVFEIREGRVVEIERLSFVGNRAYSDRRLRQVLETKQAGLLRQLMQSDVFVADRIELDKQLLRDFYAARGYIDFEVLDATAEVSRERDGTFVTFTIREGQSFRVGEVTMVSEIPEIDPAEFEAVLRLRPGVTYSPTIVENNIIRLENLAVRKGLTFVQFEPRITRNDRDQTLDVEFAMVRGRRLFVERIDIEGNTTTLDQVVRRQFRTVEGDPFNPREIRQAAERIRALGYFTQANVEAEKGSAPDQVIVNVDVEEQPTGSVSIGASFGVSAGLGLTFGFTEQNFLGRGQTLGVSIGNTQDSTNSYITFVEPGFLDRDLRLRLNAYYTVTNDEYADYDTRNIGFSPSIEFPTGENTRLEVRYRISEDLLKNLDTGQPDDPATPENEFSSGSSVILRDEEARGALVSSSVGYTWSYDSRRTGIDPNSGYLFRFSQDFGGLGGDTKFIRTTALALAERRVMNEELTLRAILEGGIVNSFGGDTTRVTDRFFGNGKIRGFEYNGLGPRDLNVTNRDALGGDIFAVARFEADFPLGLPEEYGVKGGLFFDVGSVWSLETVDGGLSSTDGLDIVDDGFALRSSVGFSVFWDTPVGPLRFNFSKALQKESYDREQSFDLTISTKF